MIASNCKNVMQCGYKDWSTVLCYGDQEMTMTEMALKREVMMTMRFNSLILSEASSE